jgi:hypothetical protein
MDKIQTSTLRLLAYIESEAYRGYDPYDALTSPIFSTKLFSHKILRFGFQQLIKRSPFNLRPLLGIPIGYNPVTLGLCIQGYTNLISVYPKQKSDYENRILFLIGELKKQIPSGFHGACWGYDFPWQARYVDIPAFQPTVVVTGIITNALYICYKKIGLSQAMDLCLSAAEFVLHDLYRSQVNDSFCLSYSPFDKQQVYNASAKGIRLLAQVYSVTKDENLKSTAAAGVKYILNNQQPDGSWYYSEAGNWVDNYHTGYVLDCLNEYQRLTGDSSVEPQLSKGYLFYKEHFITEEGIPKIKSTQVYPVDCTAAAQALLTFTGFDDQMLAKKVANWMIDHMQSPEGYYYYQKYQRFTKKTSFMRWSNAWMFAGLSNVMAAKI